MPGPATCTRKHLLPAALPPLLQVQHRGLRENSAIDLATIDFLVRAVKLVAPDFDYQWLVDESKENLPLGEPGSSGGQALDHLACAVRLGFTCRGCLFSPTHSPLLLSL